MLLFGIITLVNLILLLPGAQVWGEQGAVHGVSAAAAAGGPLRSCGGAVCRGGPWHLLLLQCVGHPSISPSLSEDIGCGWGFWLEDYRSLWVDGFQHALMLFPFLARVKHLARHAIAQLNLDADGGTICNHTALPWMLHSHMNLGAAREHCTYP